VEGRPVTGRSDFRALKTANGTCVLGLWFYQVEGLTVTPIFVDPGESWRNLIPTRGVGDSPGFPNQL